MQGLKISYFWFIVNIKLNNGFESFLIVACFCQKRFLVTIEYYIYFRIPLVRRKYHSNNFSRTNSLEDAFLTSSSLYLSHISPYLHTSYRLHNNLFPQPSTLSGSWMLNRMVFRNVFVCVCSSG